MTAPRLSICIATLNRAAFLGHTLESILSQARGGLEIVIVDGASTDDTPEVVAEAQRRFDGIRYVRLPRKGGVDQDYARTVAEASGEYCWLFTDDDVLSPGAIDAVWSRLNGECDLIIVNANVKDENLDRVFMRRCLQIDEDRIYPAAQFETFFEDVADFMSFIGCVVIRREIWLNRDPSKYFGTAFVHVGVIFEQVLANPVAVIAAPLVSIRFGNWQWNSRAFEISLFNWPTLVWSVGDFSERARRKVSHPEPWRNLSVLLFHRARGTYSMVEYRRLLSGRAGISMTTRLRATAVACLPAVPLNLALVAYFMARSKRSAASLRLFDLQTANTHYRRWLHRVLGRLSSAGRSTKQ